MKKGIFFKQIFKIEITKIFQANIVLVAILAIVFGTGCEKRKKGVLEERKTFATSIGAPTISYGAYPVDGNQLNITPGEVVTFAASNNWLDDDPYTTYEYVYWPDKSVKNLGYTEKTDPDNKGYTKLGEMGHHYMTKEGSSTPGKNGYWSGDKTSGNNTSGNNTGGGTGTGDATVVFYLASNNGSNAFNILVDGVRQVDAKKETKNLYGTYAGTPDCNTSEIGPNPAWPSWNAYNIIKVNVTAGKHSWQAPSSSSQQSYSGSFTVDAGGCEVIAIRN